jgi:8-oxo-dGTP pyrophosphatase MutT (NUDIX family)
LSFLDHIRACNRRDMGHFRPFIVAGESVGWVKRPFLDALAQFPDLFRIDARGVTLDPDLATPEARTHAVDAALRQLTARGLIRGWRDEVYPVSTEWGAAPLMLMERAAVPHFGIRAYGVHVNGYVRAGERLSLWIGRRAIDKPTYPGMLDNMVAGGQPAALSLLDNLIKEAHEEANVPASLARRSVSVGAVSYSLETEEGLRPDVLFVYDLELAPDFVPRNLDGEISTFMLWPAERVAEIVRDTKEFKFNCNLVVIDFLVRHGLIPPEHPDYLAIVQGLHG